MWDFRALWFAIELQTIYETSYYEFCPSPNGKSGLERRLQVLTSYYYTKGWEAGRLFMIKKNRDVLQEIMDGWCQVCGVTLIDHSTELGHQFILDLDQDAFDDEDEEVKKAKSNPDFKPWNPDEE